MAEHSDFVGLARWAVADALHAAMSIAGRASDQFEGTDAASLFHRLRDVIGELRDNSPEMKAISRAVYAERRMQAAPVPRSNPSVQAPGTRYETIIYSHRDEWAWRIEDADGKTVEDSTGTYRRFDDAVRTAVETRDHWNSTPRQPSLP